MSPERTGEESSPEEAPDWFEAEENGGASADPSAGEDRWLDDVAAEGWFDDPEHRPIDTGEETTDEPAEPAPGDAFDGEIGTSDETAGATGSTGPPGAETTEPREPDAAVTTDDPGTGADRGVTPENAPEAVARPSGSDDRRTDTPGGDERETGERDDQGTTADERTASETGEVVEETGETAETDQPEDAGSYLRRILAWLRSVVGRSA